MYVAALRFSIGHTDFHVRTGASHNHLLPIKIGQA